MDFCQRRICSHVSVTDNNYHDYLYLKIRILNTLFHPRKDSIEFEEKVLF